MEVALASKMRGTLRALKEYIVIHLEVHWKNCLLAAIHRIYTRYFKQSSNSVQWIKTIIGRLALKKMDDPQHLLNVHCQSTSQKVRLLSMPLYDRHKNFTDMCMCENITPTCSAQNCYRIRPVTRSNFVIHVSNAMPAICSRVTKILLPKHAGITNLKHALNTLRTGLLNCLNARSRGLTFRHRASCT